MSEPEPKSFLPQTLTGWFVLVSAAWSTFGLIFGSVYYGFDFLRNVKQGIEDVAKLSSEQLPAVTFE